MLSVSVPVMLLDTPCFIGRTAAVFPRLIDHCSRRQLRRTEFADREAFEPRPHVRI